MLIDTHAHLYLDPFDEDRTEVIERARNAGVKRILMPNIDAGTMDALHRVEAEFPDYCQAMMGLHPCSVGENVHEQLQKVRAQLDTRAYVAVGEIGMDLYWDKSYRSAQEEAFVTQVHWAAELGLPIVIHSRESLDELLAILEGLAIEGLTGVFHCFGGTAAQARRIMDLGLYMGLGGIITFKNSKLGPVIEAIPVDHLILETDAPYLTPHPHRGKRNESSYVKLVAGKLAEIHGTSYEAVVARTGTNAMKLFFPAASH